MGIDDDGEFIYPRLREYTRNNLDYPKLDGMRELLSWSKGDSRVYLLCSDVEFVRAVVNTFKFAVFIVPIQGRVALLWRFIYDGENGLLNTILGYLTFGRFQPLDWIGRPETALTSIIAMSVWQAVGFHMVIWLAGLQAIPTIRYEAAQIDGARSWQQFRYVTWPGLHNTAVFISLVITISVVHRYMLREKTS